MSVRHVQIKLNTKQSKGSSPSISHNFFNNNLKIGDGIQTSRLIVPTSQILVTLTDADIAAHLLLKHPEIWDTFYSTVTRLRKKFKICSCKYRCSKGHLQKEVP